MKRAERLRLVAAFKETQREYVRDLERTAIVMEYERDARTRAAAEKIRSDIVLLAVPGEPGASLPLRCRFTICKQNGDADDKALDRAKRGKLKITTDIDERAAFLTLYERERKRRRDERKRRQRR